MTEAVAAHGERDSTYRATLAKVRAAKSTSSESDRFEGISAVGIRASQGESHRV